MIFFSLPLCLIQRVILCFPESHHIFVTKNNIQCSVHGDGEGLNGTTVRAAIKPSFSYIYSSYISLWLHGIELLIANV